MTIIRKREGLSPKFSASVWKDSFGETEALAVRTFAIPFLQTRPDSALRRPTPTSPRTGSALGLLR